MSQPFEPRVRSRAQLDRDLLCQSEEDRLREIRARGNDREERIIAYAVRQFRDNNNEAPLRAIKQLKRLPVPIDEFIESDEFLGNLIDVYFSLRADLRRINPDILVGEPPVYEVILGGAIGTGKTTTAIITVLYQLYLLTCFNDPQRLFGLAPSTKLVFAVQSVMPEVTHTAIFEPLRGLVEEMPYAQRHWKWNPRKKKALEFEEGIKIVPVIPSVRATAGQAVIGAILDEANLMAIVERSKRVAGPTGTGGLLDQAQELYRHHSRRRKSRFITQGFSIGTLCVIGSANYKGDFVNRRMEEARTLKEANVVIISHSQYEVVPQNRFSGETFRLQVGNDHFPTRILDDDDAAAEGLHVEQVPVEYRVDFQRDAENSLRDIVGIASGAIRPFFDQRDKIVKAFEMGSNFGLRSWTYKSDVELAIDGLPQWNEDALPSDRSQRRYIHVDLSFNRNRCGIAVVKVPGMTYLSDPQSPEIAERVPQFIVECAITIQPSPAAELDIGALRSRLFELKSRHGFKIKSFSFDGFQSKESQQWLRKAGIRASEISVDRTTEPYDHLRHAVYEGRVAMVENDILFRELSQLEFNAEKGKVDHPPRGSKDLADAVAGAVFAASQDRRTRARTGPVDSRGDFPRERRNIQKREPKRRNIERKPGRPRRKSNGQIVKEQRDAAYQTEWARQDAAAERARSK